MVSTHYKEWIYMNLKRLEGRIAVVTGASRGIGRAIALRLAAEGALVAVHYRTRRDSAAETVSAIEAAGGTAFAIGAKLDSLEESIDFFRSWMRNLSAERASTILISWLTMPASAHPHHLKRRAKRTLIGCSRSTSRRRSSSSSNRSDVFETEVALSISHLE